MNWRDLQPTHPGTLLEDKSATLALHYRRAAGAEAAAREVDEDRSEASLGAAYRVQEGKMVLELKPHRPNKRTVVEDFMAEAPFRDRVPVFVGDDITDEDGFAAAQSVGGAAIVVGLEPGGGRTSVANYGLSGVRELHRWLDALCDGLAGDEPMTPSEVRPLDGGVIGNCSFGALIDPRGRICWACLPHFDGDPVFHSLLGCTDDRDP